MRFAGDALARLVAGLVAVVVGLPLLLPVLAVKWMLPRSERILTPIVDGLKDVCYWWPRTLLRGAWHACVAVVEWTAIVAIVTSLGVARVVVGIWRGDRPGSDLPTRAKRGVGRLGDLSFYALGGLLILLLSVSYVSGKIGRLFRQANRSTERLVEYFVTERELENLRADVRAWATRRMELTGAFEEVDSMEAEELVEESQRRRTETKEDIGRGEFLSSVLIAVFSLGLTFVPSLETVRLGAITVFGTEVGLSLLSVCQVLVSVVTLLLLLSVVIRIRVIDYFTIEDVSTADEMSELVFAASWNATFATSLLVVPIGILFGETTSFGRDVDDSTIEESLESTTLRGRVFRDICASIEESHPDR
ncbi:hypothetical protein [Salinigranum salinum]|uniref:hypothetical protein n=1 Tax=Salinigranum salinum TaxID=1364937 RepID=UPI0012605201|nr:hypothetical protein [Salinigranum salinum]